MDGETVMCIVKMETRKIILDYSSGEGNVWWGGGGGIAGWKCSRVRQRARLVLIHVGDSLGCWRWSAVGWWVGGGPGPGRLAGWR